MFNEERAEQNEKIRSLEVENERLTKELVYFIKVAYMDKPVKSDSWVDRVIKASYKTVARL